MNILSLDLKYVLTFQLTLMIQIMFPELIPAMCQYMIKQWSSQKSRWLERRNKQSVKEHSSFCEIDMRKFR
jgi:hypothetical protein